MPKTTTAKKLIKAARKLSKRLSELSFEEPVTHVYNPLEYAWKSHQAYLSLAPETDVKVLMLGMNPGPWGMAQTGVPFGEVNSVTEWIGIDQPVDHPANEHPKRIIEGFDCQRSEVSGRRLWGLFRSVYPNATHFFADHFVANYCPLVFMESSGRNRTPDKLPAKERKPLDQACDEHLKEVIHALAPEYLIGVGAYAEKCLLRVRDSMDYEANVSRILHPSPASPAANKDWAGTATRQLKESGVW